MLSPYGRPEAVSASSNMTCPRMLRPVVRRMWAAGGIDDAIAGEEISHDGRVFGPCHELPRVVFHPEEREILPFPVLADDARIACGGKTVPHDADANPVLVVVEALDDEACPGEAPIGRVLAKHGRQSMVAHDAFDDCWRFRVHDGVHMLLLFCRANITHFVWLITV